MEHYFKNLFTIMKAEKLAPLERAELRKNMVLRMRGYQPTYKEISSLRTFFSMHRVRVLVGAAIFLLVTTTGGVSYAAEISLPGSALYKLKIVVNEPLREALAFSPASRARVEATLAERRLSEVAELATRGELTPALEASLLREASERSVKFVQKITESKNSVDSVYAAELSSRLEGELEARITVSKSNTASRQDVVRAGGSESKTTISSVPSSASNNTEGMLQQSLRAVSAVRAQAEKKVKARPLPVLQKVSQVRLETAEEELQKIQKDLEQKKVGLSSQALLFTEKSIENARAALEDGKKGIKVGGYPDTLPRLLEAERKVRSARSLLDASVNQSEE